MYTTSMLARGLTAIVAQDPAITRTDLTVRSAGVAAIQPNSRGCGQGRSQGRSWARPRPCAVPWDECLRWCGPMSYAAPIPPPLQETVARCLFQDAATPSTEI